LVGSAATLASIADVETLFPIRCLQARHTCRAYRAPDLLRSGPEGHKAISRNRERFPEDFMFQLTKAETEALRFQIGTSNVGRGGRRYLPYAFTQEGVAMLSSVLNSSRAIHVNIVIMRAFVKLREIMFTHKDLAHKIEALERKYAQHDEEIQVIFKTIKKLLAPPKSPKLRIGFNPNPK
jgi:hypothetical protein